MNVCYKMGDEKNIIIIKNKIDKFLSNKIDSISSDKKVLLVYDKKIEKKLVLQIIKILKQSGCFLIALEFQGNKKNKNEKSLFSLLSTMLDNKFTKKSIVISLGGGSYR